MPIIRSIVVKRAAAFEGFGLYNLYYKSALDKFNITPHVFRVGTYKSFVEPFTQDDMSAKAREANGRWLDQMWHYYVNDVAKARHLAADVVSPDKRSTALPTRRRQRQRRSIRQPEQKLVDHPGRAGCAPGRHRQICRCQ